MSVYIRDQKKGVYYIRFEYLGEKVHKSARTKDKREASRLEEQWREQIRRVKLLGHRDRRTFDQLMDRFIDEHLPTLKPSAQTRYLASIKAMLPHFEGVFMDEIDRRAINSFIQARKKTVTGSTVRKDLACLSSAFSLAISWDWCDINPVTLIDMRQAKHSAPRTRWLTWSEFQRLHSKAPAYMKDAILLCVLTGLRVSELWSLKWSQVNWDRKELFIPVTKTDTPRTIPLTTFDDMALECLKRHPRHFSSPYIFCKKNGRPYTRMTRGLDTVVKNAGIAHCTWHDLRRTCGSWLLQSGMDIFRVSRWLGHKSVATTERSYAFLNSQSLHEAAQNLPHSTWIAKSNNEKSAQAIDI